MAGVPAVIVGGVLFGKYIGGKMEIGVPEYFLEAEEDMEEEQEEGKRPRLLA